MSGTASRGRLGLRVLAVCAAVAACAPTSPPASPTGGSSSPLPTATSATASPSVSPSPSSGSPAPTSTGTPTATPTPYPTSTALPSWLSGTDVTRIPTTRHVVALTFDGGANAAGLASILATLRATGAPGSFFLTGRFATTFPAQSRAITAAGYVVGNHTMTHPHPTQLTDAELTAQVRDAETAIRSVTGADPRPWFRFPYGEHTSADVALVNRLGYAAIFWGVDTLGWEGTSGGQSVATIRARVLRALTPGLVVLMHLGSNPTDDSTLDADALPFVIADLRARGYEPVPLTAMLVRP